jgi:hypothetical protein
MHGKGSYWFNGTESPPVLHVGAYKENELDGFGKMLYRDGTKYFGNFKQSAMQSDNAKIEFGNQDVYEGAVRHS